MKYLVVFAFIVLATVVAMAWAEEEQLETAEQFYGGYGRGYGHRHGYGGYGGYGGHRGYGGYGGYGGYRGYGGYGGHRGYGGYGGHRGYGGYGGYGYGR